MRKLMRPSRNATCDALTFRYSSGSGTSRWPGRDPVADDAGADHVGEKFIALAIPDEDDGAGTAAAIDFRNFLTHPSSNFYFILQHAGRPKHAHHIRFGFRAQPNVKIERPLAQISRSPADFKFLPHRTGEDVDFRANGRFIVIGPAKRKFQPIIFVAAHVAQQHWRRAELRNEQPHRAITVKI